MTREINIEEEVWNEIFKTLFTVSGKVCERALYEGGRVKAANLFKEKNIKKEEDIIRVLKEEDIIKNGKIEGNKIIVSGSFEADVFKNSNKPMCFFLAGIFGNLISLLRDEKIKVVEKSCKAKGDEKCIFEIKNLEWYEKMEDVMEEL